MAVNKFLTHRSSVFVVLVHFVIGVAALATPAQAQAPAGYWTFDDGSGTKAADSSGNGHPATLVNGINWVTGNIGGAVSATSVNKQYVSIPAIDLSGTHAVTVSLWVNRSYSTAGGQVLFEASSDYTNSTTGFGFFPDDATCHGIQAALRGDVGLSANCYSPPSSGVWHHLAAVFDKSQTGGNQVQFYVDGALQPANWSLYSSTNTNDFGNNPIYLFSRAGASEFSSGAMADLRIYNTALTAAQIQKLYDGALLVSLAITPSNLSLSAGQQQQFTATGTYKDGSTRNLSRSVTWTPSAPSVVNISGGGTATALAAGTVAITATSGSIRSSTGLTVTPSTLVSIAVTPTNPSIAAGQQQQFTATGAYSDGSHQILTNSVAWTSSMPSVAYMGGGNGATGGGSGLAVALAAGSTIIQATSGAISGSTRLTVTPPVLVSIAVTPVNPSIAAGRQQQFTATGTYSDASKKDLTSTATWTSSAPSVATISGGGLATGLTAGNTVIKATLGSISGSTSLTVTAATLVSIAVTPANPSIAVGRQQQFTATGTYSDGSHQNLTSTATWTSSAPSVATISGGGLATGLAAGNTVIKATLGSISGSTSLAVTAATLVSIAVTPANPSIAVGQQQQFTATGTYSNGSHQNLTSTAAWTSSAPSVATISSVGLATSVAAGSTTIRATSGSINGSTGLTVASQPLVSLAWTASTSLGVIGYNTYRSNTSGGPYTMLNSNLIPIANYNDQTVHRGFTYYYVTTAVDSHGLESAYSNQAVAAVP